MEIEKEEIKSKNLDHHGIVAGICKDLGISSKIDKRMKSPDRRRVISTGTSVTAMILNGLGFTNRRLYLCHQFFKNKPIDLLLKPGIRSEDITDHTLGMALDEIHEYGSSKLFGEIAFEVAEEQNLLGSSNHIDTTSMSVNGKYDTDGEVNSIDITHGFSKDHRPDLKQVILSLVVNGKANLPLWMEGLDGNSSDKKNFHDTIAKVQKFQEQLKSSNDFHWVGDSAFYSKDKLVNASQYLWTSRVPETSDEAKKLIEKPKEEISWKAQDKGYQISHFKSNYGEVEQRWILVFSKQAFDREKKNFEKKLLQEEAKLKKQLWHLSKETFSCKQDARKALLEIEKKHPYFTLPSKIISLKKHKKRGRPKKNEEPQIVSFQIQAESLRKEDKIEKKIHSKGRFILATNNLDVLAYPNYKVLEQYKQQQSVEAGFRFLKDPWFMVDSIFLKSPARIEALMMVMCLCLLVYNFAQYKLRDSLHKKNDTLPNQLNKEVKNPTLRWIFQIMEGIGLVQFYESNFEKPIREVVTNITELRKKIILFFGSTVQRLYGIIPKKVNHLLGM